MLVAGSVGGQRSAAVIAGWLMPLDSQWLSPWAALVSRLARKRLSTVDSLSMNLSLCCWRRGPPDTQQTHIRSANAALDTPLGLQRPAVDRQATGREGT